MKLHFDRTFAGKTNLPEHVRLEIKDEYDLVLDNSAYPVKQMIIPVRIREETERAGVLVNVCHDTDGNAIATTGVCKLHLSDGVLNALITAVDQGENCKMTVALYDSDWRPLQTSGVVSGAVHRKKEHAPD